ncbi:hypothetical protein ACFL2Q_19355 [Thermodesulfobacteriota bacterium]
MFVFGTSDDVFVMAIRIIENGRALYAGAAEGTQDPVLKKLFQDLAELEDGHLTLVKYLRVEYADALPEGEVWDPEGLAAGYLGAAADTHVFTHEAAKDRMRQVKTAPEALEMAIQFEKDTVHFFLAMKEMLPDRNGKDKLDALIIDEMDRIRKFVVARKTCKPTTCEIPC